MMKYIKQIAVGAVVIVVFVIYGLYSKMSGSSTSVNTISNNQTQTSVPVSTGNAIAYKDGSYTGSVADAYFGSIQVKAIISGGVLTDVQFLQYPNDNNHSADISASSEPILRSEAIQSQSANVNIVSGATQTSQGFEQSLASALAQAKA